LALSLLAAGSSSAQQSSAPAPGTPPPAAAAPAPPPFATTKVEGTDNVYVFRYGGHQSMFIVTPEGVIATDPIAYLRPQAATTYIDEIKKITQAPIRYVIYSHHHYDHIAGGKPFKDLGATSSRTRTPRRASRPWPIPTSSSPTRWSTTPAGP